MLKTLTVWNFALLEHVQVEFGPGLNILTGETGAGKSILIDSLGAILGNRISSDSIRTGCEWLRVEAVFSLESEPAALHEYLASQAIDDSEGMLIITRQVTHGGRNMVLVNGCHVTLTVLKKIGSFLVDVHGQNENLALLKEESQFALLDGYDAELSAALSAYRESYDSWRSCCKQYAEKEQASREYAQRLDMLRWQDKEIEGAQLKEREDEELEAQIRKLSHAEKIAGYVEESYNLLENGSKEGSSVLASLSKIKKNLLDMSRFDDSMANAQKMVEEAFISLQEAAYELRDYGEGMDFSPEKLDKLQQRMDIIYKLRKKYGTTIEEILAHQKKVQQELQDIENYDEDMQALEKQIELLKQDLTTKAERVTKLRTQAAEELGVSIGRQLTALGMPKAVFRIAVTPAGKFQSNGADAVAMYFSANPGEAEKPLQKVASGGELSRIALAIKTVAASRDAAVPSMVFDEIDTGIGGRTAQMVAERIALVARFKQVLCITHLPQIACMADVHLYISKSTAAGATITQVRQLTERERISEVARMASGVDVTAASLDNAKEMVSHAMVVKNNFS